MSNYSLQLPRLPSTTDKKLYDQLEPLYLAFNAVNNNFLYSCGVSRVVITEHEKYKAKPFLTQPHNLNRLIVTAGVDLAFGFLINLHLDAGVVKARLAEGGAGNRPAVGYCNHSGGVLAGETCEVIINTGLLGVAGATVGTQYYLSATPGTLTTAPPGSGLVQPVGFGILPDYVYISCF